MLSTASEAIHRFRFYPLLPLLSIASNEPRRRYSGTAGIKSRFGCTMRAIK